MSLSMFTIISKTMILFYGFKSSLIVSICHIQKKTWKILTQSKKKFSNLGYYSPPPPYGSWKFSYSMSNRVEKCQICWISYSSKLSGYNPHRTVTGESWSVNQSSSFGSTKWPLTECLQEKQSCRKLFSREHLLWYFFVMYVGKSTLFDWF